MKKRWAVKKIMWRNRELLFVMAVSMSVVISIPLGFQLKHRHDEVKLGVSFSIKYATELGLDWKQAYTALLDDLEVKQLRLMSYWDLSEPANDEYMFEDLDWQISQAEQAGASVSLALGQRQPRWPECHIPRWTSEVDEATRNAQLLEYITEVVNRYKDNPAVISYQVENEASNARFGDCPEYDADFLKQEIELVKSIDPESTVITNVSNQSGTPLFGPVQSADKVGFSIYKNAHFDALGNKYGWSFWYVPSQWHGMRAALVEGLIGTETFVHELQAEPWGPDATVNLSIQEQNKTMDAERLRSITEFAKQTGMKEVYLWGGEWWYWRLIEHNDTELWDAAKIMLQEANVSALAD